MDIMPLEVALSFCAFWFPAIINNMVEAQTCEVGTALASFNVESWTYVYQ
jgi:hypothetical protein